MPVPAQPKIYHIVHVDRLPSIVADQGLWCDAEVGRRGSPGTAIGMTAIKQRRLAQLTLTSHAGLHVGECVPFYFCPRSVMLFLMHRSNHPELTYHGGQSPIIHLEADLHEVVTWANQHGRCWAFTLSNAGASYFEDRCDLSQLDEINWDAVQTNQWSGAGISASVKEGKQAEFLLQAHFPWELVKRIGVHTAATHERASLALPPNGHRPSVEVRPQWYY